MRIVILHASAGHGHAKAGAAIKEGLIVCGVPEKEILLLDALDETPAWFRWFYTSSYFYSVKYASRMWGMAFDLTDREKLYQNFLYPLRGLLNSSVGQGLIRRMMAEKPEVILFTHFMAPEVLGRAKQKDLIRSKLITVVTDFMPHRFWINPGTDHYWVMSEEGKQSLENRGVPGQSITTGGIPISPLFRPNGKREEFRKKEGLDGKQFTILITSGSFGLGPTAEILEVMKEFGKSLQILVVCGKNETLYRNLEKRQYPFHLRLYGFVSHMDQLMEASDLLIAKPGGITTCESLAKGIPMVVLEPIPGQETGNARLLQERNAAFFLHKPEDIRVILKGILDYPEVLGEKKRSIERLAKPDAAIDIARFVLQQIGG